MKSLLIILFLLDFLVVDSIYGMNTWIYNCHKCNKELIYNRKNRWENAHNKHYLCRECRKNQTWNRRCPQCDKELIYHQKRSCVNGEVNKLLCRSCTMKAVYAIPQNNPFYGKHHTEATKRRLSNIFKGIKQIKGGQKKGHPGQSNPMFGKNIYEVWVVKYGREEADRRLISLSKKRSINATGELNPMFGKPAPQGAGNGWSGWYRGVYFRSLRELTFMISLDKEGIEWRSAEWMKIPYSDWKGNNRTYRPDFILGKEVVEVKPIKLHKTPSMMLKCEAATNYCHANGLTFSIIDPGRSSDEEIRMMRQNGKIKFAKNYEEKYNGQYGTST